MMIYKVSRRVNVFIWPRILVGAWVIMCILNINMVYTYMALNWRLNIDMGTILTSSVLLTDTSQNGKLSETH